MYFNSTASARDQREQSWWQKSDLPLCYTLKDLSDKISKLISLKQIMKKSSFFKNKHLSFCQIEYNNNVQELAFLFTIASKKKYLKLEKRKPCQSIMK